VLEVIRVNEYKIKEEKYYDNDNDNMYYIYVTDITFFFRFRDDFEMYIDNSTNTLNFRSASRVGYGDMGVNRERVDDFVNTLKSYNN